MHQQASLHPIAGQGYTVRFQDSFDAIDPASRRRSMYMGGRAAERRVYAGLKHHEFLEASEPGSVLGKEILRVMAAPRKYPDELRQRAVRLVFESDRPIAHVAPDLGIHREALRLRVRQAEADSGRRRDLLTSEEREELKRLRRENAELRRANAILEGRLRVFCAGDRPDAATVTRYVQERRDAFGVGPVCRAIGVPVSTSCARRSRKPSRRELEDRKLVAEIHAACARNW